MRRPGARRTLPALTAVAALLLAVTGCGADSGERTAGPGPAGGLTGAMARHGLDGLDAVQLVDHLDRLGATERPTDLMASVRPGEVLLSTGDEERRVELPEDRFYLSFAPYVAQTHECFHHSLTTCQGELTTEEVEVEVRNLTNDTVLIDGTRTTFANGFVGLWLPRGITGRLTVTRDGKVGTVDFTTTEDAPTCLTTLQLA